MHLADCTPFTPPGPSFSWHATEEVAREVEEAVNIARERAQREMEFQLAEAERRRPTRRGVEGVGGADVGTAAVPASGEGLQ